MKDNIPYLCFCLIAAMILHVPLAAQQLVTVRNTKIRTSPARNGKMLERVEKGTLLFMLETPGESNSNFYKVKCHAANCEGWVVESAVVKITPQARLSTHSKYKVATANFGVGQIPPGYYEAASGLTGDSLKGALHRIIRNHKPFTYDEIYGILGHTDRDPEDSMNVILLYSGWTVQAMNKDHGGRYNYEAHGYVYEDAWNREHVWPKSHGFPNEKDTAYTDVHHIRPADRTINTERNTRSFNYCTVPFADNKDKVMTKCKTDSIWTWEPPDFVKGDIARMLFYMAVRYEGYMQNGELKGNLELVDENVPRGNKAPVMGKLSVLLQWHELDPVDNWERRRNDVIFRKYQGNRNPFIDRPEFVNLIWKTGP